MGLETKPVLVKTHFDGRVFVPDSPIDLPAGTPMEGWVVGAETHNGDETVLRSPGSAKAQGLKLFLSEDFDAPLEEFEDYK